MSMEATAEALAPEQPVQVPEVEQGPSPDDQMAEIWDKANQEPEDQTPDEPVEEAKAEDKPAEKPETPETAKVETPTDIPRQLREHWSKFPEETRTAVEDFARETNRKLSEQGRLLHGITPIKEVLTEAMKDFPQLADRSPQDVAKEVFTLARISAEFETNPVKTMLGLIEKHGLKDQITQAMQGQPVSDSITPLKQQIANLQRQLKQATDPNFIRSHFDAFASESDTLKDVKTFAANAEHWQAVEDKLPPYVDFMRAEMGQDASPTDVLQAAYDLAVSRIVPTENKAPEQAADQAADVVDPERTKAALKAKSVNVRSQPSKPRALTEEELLSQVWDKSQKR